MTCVIEFVVFVEFVGFVGFVGFVVFKFLNPSIRRVLLFTLGTCNFRHFSSLEWRHKDAKEV